MWSSAFFMEVIEGARCDFRGKRREIKRVLQTEKTLFYTKILCFFFVLALIFANFVPSLYLFISYCDVGRGGAVKPNKDGDNMKKTFLNCINRIFTGALTLLGFAATMTLAACYGPRPEKYYTDEEVVDSLAVGVDSVAVDTEL